MMSRAIKCWVLLVVCLAPLLSLASPYDYLLHRSYAQRVHLTDSLAFPALLELPYKDALQAITAMEQKALKEEDKGLYCEMKLMHLHYYDFKDLTNIDSTIKELLTLRTWVQKNRLPEYDICIAFDLANNFYRKRDYQAAFGQYIQVSDALSNLTATQFPRKKEFLVSIGNRYYNFGDNESAQTLLLAADSLPPSSGNSLYRTNYNNKNTLGLVYRNNGLYDSALYCFQQVVHMAKAVNDTIWAGIAEGNIGIVYYLQQKYELAIPFLEQDVQTGVNLQRKFCDSWVNSLLTLADIHLSLNQPGKAEQYISLAGLYLSRTVDSLKYKGMYYNVMAAWNAKRGDYQASCRYKDSAFYYKDSLVRRDNKLLLNYAQHKADAQKHLLIRNELDAKKKLLLLGRNVTIGAFCLFMVIALLLWNRMRLRHIIRQNKLTSEKALAEQELKSTTEQLNGYTRNLLEKNALIERSEQEILQLTQRLQTQETTTADNEILTRLYESTILTEAQWDEFRQLFNKVHKGFLLRLREKVPQLSPAETRFVVMCKLKLPAREMASLLGVQPDSLRTYRHRLRKKLNLPEDASIEDMADTI